MFIGKKAKVNFKVQSIRIANISREKNLQFSSTHRKKQLSGLGNQ